MKVQLTLGSWLVAACVAATSMATDIKAYNLPPAERLFSPGPGVGGPGPGVIPPALPPTAIIGGGGIGGAAGLGLDGMDQTVQILFSRPESMQVRWSVSSVAHFDSEPLIVPGRQNFPAGGIYRLKITNIAGREGVELYPTVEIGPTTPRTAAYLAHNAIPIQFTEEDFDQVLSANFVTKVIYLPDPEFQEMALAGVETLVSTRLDPGVDPILEADRRGSIMAVVRLGNKDVEMPGAMGDQVFPASFESHPNLYGPGPSTMGGSPTALPLSAMALGQSSLGPTGLTPAYVSGITGLTYGMPWVGTPIGLPGPPHIPLGHPAGFQRQVMKDKTHYHIPGPVESFTIRMREQPGYSYPRPPTHMHIREQHIHPSLPFRQPYHDQTQVIPMNDTGYRRHLGHSIQPGMQSAPHAH